MSGTLRKISTYRRCRARTTHLSGVVRSVPTTEPISSAITQAASAVSERPAQADDQVVEVGPRAARLGLRAGSPSSSCSSRRPVLNENGEPKFPVACA